MKRFFVFGLLLSNLVFGLEVVQAEYDEAKDLLQIQIEYTGGCVEHQFEMQITECILSKTQNIGLMNICDAQIIDVSEHEDSCAGTVRRTLVVSLRSLGKDARPDLLGFNHTNVVLVPKKG